MTMKIVDVLVPVALDHAYTYRVPAAGLSARRRGGGAVGAQ